MSEQINSGQVEQPETAETSGLLLSVEPLQQGVKLSAGDDSSDTSTDGGSDTDSSDASGDSSDTDSSDSTTSDSLDSTGTSTDTDLTDSLGADDGSGDSADSDGTDDSDASVISIDSKNA